MAVGALDVSIVGVEDLIAMKQAAGGDQDLVDSKRLQRRHARGGPTYLRRRRLCLAARAAARSGQRCASGKRCLEELIYDSGRVRTQADMLNAATAAELGLVLVTRNGRDFAWSRLNAEARPTEEP